MDVNRVIISDDGTVHSSIGGSSYINLQRSVSDPIHEVGVTMGV